MEIRINREVRNYHESIFFGLSARQFGCSLGYQCCQHTFR